MKLIIGLGNFGQEYEHTRHNIGWDAVALAAARLEATIFKEKTKFQAALAEGSSDGEKILFVHPLTYMNRSGEAVRLLAGFYRCPIKDILVVQDEMDFPLGALAFIQEGGSANHNGVTSIQEALGTKAVARLRLGIGRPPSFIKTEDYVLQTFSKDEQVQINSLLEQAALAIQTWITHGVEAAMNEWNHKNS